MSELPVCPICKGTCYIDTPAVKFIHEQVHAEPFGQQNGLGNLPFSLFPAVAKLMEDYTLARLAALRPRIEELLERASVGVGLEAMCFMNRWRDDAEAVLRELIQ